MVLLYYYTGQKHLRKILQKKRVKVSRYGLGRLNDPFEQTPYDISDVEFRFVHRRIIDTFARHIGLICLSKTRCSPAMWAHYADNHAGACLEIEVSFDHLIKIKYATEKLFQGADLKKFSDQLDFNDINHIKQIWGTKSKDWSYEEEHRFHVPLGNKVVIKELELYFMPFQEKSDNTFMLKRVFVGYRCAECISNLKDYVQDYQPGVEIIQTVPSYSSFKVVDQLDEHDVYFRELEGSAHENEGD